MMISEFEKVLRYGRKDKKLSQYDVAKMAGLDTTTIHKMSKIKNYINTLLDFYEPCFMHMYRA